MDARTQQDDHAFRLGKVSIACGEIVAATTKLNAVAVALEHAGVSRSLNGIASAAEDAEKHARAIATLAASVRRGVQG